MKFFCVKPFHGASIRLQRCLLRCREREFSPHRTDPLSCGPIWKNTDNAIQIVACGKTIIGHHGHAPYVYKSGVSPNTVKKLQLILPTISVAVHRDRHSTVTLFARLRGLCGHVTSLCEVSVHQAQTCRLRRPALHAAAQVNHSTVTDFARLRGLSTSVPRARAV